MYRLCGARFARPMTTIIIVFDSEAIQLVALNSICSPTAEGGVMHVHIQPTYLHVRVGTTMELYCLTARGFMAHN